jgi:hypothetical protein
VPLFTLTVQADLSPAFLAARIFSSASLGEMPSGETVISAAAALNKNADERIAPVSTIDFIGLFIFPFLLNYSKKARTFLKHPCA